MKRGNKYDVTWIDGVSYHGWYDKNDLDTVINNYRVKTTGYVVDITKLFVVVALNYQAQSGKYGELMYIPRKSIIKITLL